MVLSMKLISVAFDMDADIQNEVKKKEEIDKDHQDQSEVVLSKKDVRKRKFLQSKQEPNIKFEPPQDEEITIVKVPSFWAYFGYALCPGNTLFGPWVPYKEYLAIFVNPRWVIISITLIKLNFQTLRAVFNYALYSLEGDWS